jgi:leucyl aminopeptidase
MIELPDFQPLRISQASRAPAHKLLENLDHLALAIPEHPPRALFRTLPLGRQLDKLLRRERARGGEQVTTRLANGRATGLTLSTCKLGSEYELLTWARRLITDCRRDGPQTLGVFAAGWSEGPRRRILSALAAAAAAAAFELPSYKREDKTRRPRLKALRIFNPDERLDLKEITAEALGNNVARWFTAMPPNELTATAYRRAIERLARSYGLGFEFHDESKLEKLGAGAFLAVARGNASRDAGIARLRYRPARQRAPDVGLVGKGVLFDTGGTNLKPFKSMLDMHIDMQGSAVALGTLIALAELQVPYSVDAWLAITENRLSATSYKSQDVVRALDGTTIQVVHTDAEGRMVLADTLALAARAKPKLLIDYATLTGSCVTALTERYSGVFSNRPAANSLLTEYGAVCGERVWAFPMSADFDEGLRSDIADTKQCAADGQGDHILAARFLSRFVPESLPWIHLDLSAGQHKGGLAHIPTEITGFGVRFTLAVLGRSPEGPEALADSVQQ